MGSQVFNTKVAYIHLEFISLKYLVFYFRNFKSRKPNCKSISIKYPCKTFGYDCIRQPEFAGSYYFRGRDGKGRYGIIVTSDGFISLCDNMWVKFWNIIIVSTAFQSMPELATEPSHLSR
jgi:hypothetical protein